MASWIFQANQKRYRIFDAIQELEQDQWRVPQHASRIRAGDKVYIWVAGKRAGIYAKGSVLTPPRRMPVESEDLVYWVDPKEVDPNETRVLVSYEHKLLDRPLLRDDLKRRGGGRPDGYPGPWRHELPGIA